MNDQHRENNPNWKADKVTYEAAHLRVRTLGGKAIEYVCICGQQAQVWAYLHTDPHARYGDHCGKVLAYSTDPEHYMPMCHYCHKRMDAAQSRGGL